MPRFAANLSFLFKELPFLDRFEAAATAGFEAVEVLFPYDNPAREITSRLAATGLKMALINTPPPNWAGGDRGFAAIPGGQDRFRHDFKRALRFARALGADHLHVMAGKAKGVVARQTFIDNLKWAAALAPRQSLTIEPINGEDMPGYFLDDFDLAAEVIGAVNAPNLGLQFDVYHAQMITGDAARVWFEHGHLARHIQVAGCPGRHEPIDGDIEYSAFFKALDHVGFSGWVSGEYHPKTDTFAGLDWIRQAGKPS